MKILFKIFNLLAAFLIAVWPVVPALPLLVNPSYIYAQEEAISATSEESEPTSEVSQDSPVSDPEPTSAGSEETQASPAPEPTSIAPSESPDSSLSVDQNDQSNSQDQGNGSNDNKAPPSGSPSPTPSIAVDNNKEGEGQVTAEILTATAVDTLGLDLVSLESEDSATLSTDKPDYAPTDVALITGSNFSANTTYNLVITSDNLEFSDNITTDSGGSFAYFYQLDGTYRPLYKVEVKDSSGQVLATGTFTDAVRKYSATISPTGVNTTTSQTYTITITNDSTSTDKIKSATVFVPSGFSEPPTLPDTVTASNGKRWDVQAYDGTNHLIKLKKDEGGAELDNSESVVFTATTTSPGSAGVYTFTTIAYKGDTFGGDTFTIVGSQPQVTVNAVNVPPSFDAIADKSVDENSSSQNVAITNISPGPSGESGQTVTMSATSSDPTIVPNPSVSGAGSTRTLTYTPAPNKFGVVTITVTADDGQSENNIYSRTFTITVNQDTTPPTDPEDVNSTSHVVDASSSDNTIDMVWSAAGEANGATDDSSGVDGYSYAFTTGEGDVPDVVKDAEEDATGTTSDPLGDFAWYFHLRTVDNDGNWSSTVHVGPYIIDTSAPETTIDSGPSGLVSEDDATFTFSANETATFECQLDGGGFSDCTSPNTYNDLADGEHTFDVQAKDTAGNTDQTPASQSWTVDATAPTTTIGEVTDGNGAVVNADAFTKSSSISIPFTTDDGSGSGVTGSECKLDDGSYQACSTPFTAGSLSDGSHTVSIRSTDAAGNVESTATFTWNVDTLAPVDPTPVSTSHTLSEWDNDRTIAVTWSGADDGSGSGVDGFYTEWNTSETTMTGPVVKEYEETTSSEISPNRSTGQNHYFHIATVDNVGNWTSTAHLGPFWIDAANPTGSWVTPTGGSLVAGAVALEANANDVGSGVKLVRFRVKPTGGTFSTISTDTTSPYQASWDSTAVADGSYVLRAHIEDNSGRSVNKDITVTVDNTAPTTEFTSPEDGFTTNLPITISGSSTDLPATTVDYVKLSYRTSGDGEWSEIPESQQNNEEGSDPFNWSFSWTPGEQGTFDIKAEATDKASNTESSPTVTGVVYDTTGPDTPVATPGAGDYTSDQSVTLSSADSLSGLDKIFYTTDGSTPDNTKTEYTGAITVDKDMTIKAIAYDKAGNTSDILTAIYGIAPQISGENTVDVGSAQVTFVWDTDIPATSRVVYDTVSHPDPLGAAPNYGYANSTGESDTDPKVTSHTVVVCCFDQSTTYYYRVISQGSPEAASGEKSFTTPATPPQEINPNSVGPGITTPGPPGPGPSVPTTTVAGAVAGAATQLGQILGVGTQGEILAEATEEATPAASPSPTPEVLAEKKAEEAKAFWQNWWWVILLILLGGGAFWWFFGKKSKEQK